MPHQPLASVKIRLSHQDRFAMGPGKADLLEAIGAERSIAAAGRRLGLSYWKTRRLLDEMNACFREPVVVTARGGDKGGGAELSATGLRALELFRDMERRALRAIQAPVDAFKELLAD